jgi:GAF domain-containing protein/HAMP domain-containing protein
MRDFFLSLRIRIKLLAAFGSILLLSVLLIALSVTSIDKIIYYKSINEEVDILKLRLETLDLASKDFIYEGYKSKSFLETQKASSINSFTENYSAAKKIIQEIQSIRTDNETDTQLTHVLLVTLDSLQNDFNTLVNLLQDRGFKDYGLEGSLRTAIHDVENSGFEFDKATMLMLRRHEKDFFLRKDLKYQDEFNKRFDVFRQQIESSANAALLSSLVNYQTEFNKVVEIEKQIGLTEHQGIRGRIQKYFSLIRPHIESIRTTVKNQNEAQIAQTKWMLWIIFCVQIIAGIAMALIYAGLLTKSIKEIRGGMQRLASGVFPDKLRVLTTEEIGQTKIAFNQFIDRLKAASIFAGHLGAGELHAKYDDQYTNDVLAKSLISAQEKLRHAEEHQRKINWMNEGAARFNDILKDDFKETHLLGDRILKMLVTYMGANQGALYIMKREEGREFLERIATYAFDKKKFVNEQITPGSGLIGQCVLEGETIYLKDVPRDFIKITSGLGEATPRRVVIVPLKTRDLVMGVIELASFQDIEPHHLEFIERIAENITTLLANKQAASEMKRLLEESQQRSFSFAQQEEIMRQNTEEFQATQEELERQRFALQQEVKSLRLKLASVVVEL